MLDANSPPPFLILRTQATASREITIMRVPDPPIINNVKATSVQDQPIVGSLTAIDLENKPLTFTLACPPRNGTLEFLDTMSSSTGDVPFRYIPDPQSSGTDSVLVIASNGEALNAGVVRCWALTALACFTCLLCLGEARKAYGPEALPEIDSFRCGDVWSNDL